MATVGAPAPCHTQRVLALAVLASGRIVSTGIEGQLRLWQPETGHNDALADLQDRTWCTAVTTLADARVVGGGNQGELYVWDSSSGALLGSYGLELPLSYSSSQPQIYALVTLADGRVAAACEDATVRIRAIGADSSTTILDAHYDEVRALTVLPDGRLVSASWDGAVYLWHPDALHTPTLLGTRQRRITALAALPDGRFASASVDRGVRIWDPNTGQVLTTKAEHEDSVDAIVSMPDGRVVSASADHSVRVWDPDTGELLTTYLGEHPFTALALVDAQAVAAGDAVGNVAFIELGPGPSA